MDINLKTTATIDILSAPLINPNGDGTVMMSNNSTNVNISNITIKQGTFGKFISKEFANDSFNEYKKLLAHQGPNCIKNDVKRVYFSRELIDLILAQDNCEGISVYFVYPPTANAINDILSNKPIQFSNLERNISVLILGNDTGGNPLVDIEQSPISLGGGDDIIAEVGGHGDLPLFQTTTGIDFF